MTTTTIKPELDPNDIESILAFHRSVFGDARMEGDEGSGEGEGAGSEGEGEGSDESGSGESGDEGQSSEGEGDQEGQEGSEESEDNLPEWARTKLTKANGEAAKYRTRLRDLEAKFEGAKTAEEFESAMAELKEENAKLAREALVATVARKFNLPDDLADVLKGEDQTALEAHAKALQKYVPADDDPEDLSGGLGGSSSGGGEDDDPRKLAGTYGRRNP